MSAFVNERHYSGGLIKRFGGFRLRGHGGFDLRAASKKTRGLNLAKNIV